VTKSIYDIYKKDRYIVNAYSDGITDKVYNDDLSMFDIEIKLNNSLLMKSKIHTLEVENKKLEKENKILLEAVELIDCTSLNSWKGDCKCPSCKFLNKVKEIKGE